MAGITLEISQELVGLLRRLDQPVEQAAQELIVLELYRRDIISSGKAAELLGMPRMKFIQHASRLGIPYLRFDEEDWKREVTEGERL